LINGKKNICPVAMIFGANRNSDWSREGQFHINLMITVG